MVLEIRQVLKTTHRLALSAELKHSITILSLERADLEKFVAGELEKNPCLNEVSRVEKSDRNMKDLGQFLKKSTSSPSDFPRFSDDQTGFSRIKDYADNRSHQSLHDHILEQVSLLRMSPYENECIESLLQYIDDNGFLTVSLSEMSALHHMHQDDLKFALEIIQKCDPPGIGAATVQERLLLQIKRMQNVPLYTTTILKEFWIDFEKQNFLKISRALKIELEKVKDSFRFIRSYLDPKPARQFGENVNYFIVPDVYVFKRNQQWVCSLNENGLPRIKLSKKYENLFSGLKGDIKNKETVKFLNENMKAAKWLLKSLEERSKTILKVTECIIDYQKDFFNKGVEYLVPITLKDVAQELGLHESTISRSTSDKYMFSPQGIFELKYFFNTSMEDHVGKEFANESIKQWVCEYVKSENKADPLCDDEIVAKIKLNKNVKVARRTVAKYRKILGILPSTRRIQKF